MNVRQLRDYFDHLVTIGHGDQPACIAEQNPEDDRVTVIEIDRAALVTGAFQEDPSPKMPGSNISTGTVIMLTGWQQDMLHPLSVQGFVIGDLPDTPDKIQTK